MKKVSLEIVVPIYNEGEKVVRLLKNFQNIIKTEFRVLFCYDLEDDDIFNFKDDFKKFSFDIPYQSKLTFLYCKDIFNAKKLLLPTLEEHNKINKEIFLKIYKFYKKNISKNINYLPIT